MNNINISKVIVGSVLLDEDIKKEMERHPLLTDESGEPIKFEVEEYSGCLQPCCVDLHIGRIRGPDPTLDVNDINATKMIEPGEIVHIQSRERVNTPDNIMGFLVPRNTYSVDGLLMLNAGYVDPQWGDGYLEAEIINLRASPYPLKVGDKTFSVIFAYLHEPTKASKQKIPDDVRYKDTTTRLLGRMGTLFGHIRETLGQQYALKVEIESLRNQLRQQRDDLSEEFHRAHNGLRNFFIAALVIIVLVIGVPTTIYSLKLLGLWD